MSSVFEAGVSLACIVILHNWFKEEVLGTVSAVWMSSYFLQVILENSIFDAQIGDDKLDKHEQEIAKFLKY